MHRAIATLPSCSFRESRPEEGIIMDPRRPVVDDPVATTGLSRRSALLKMSAGGLAAALLLRGIGNAIAQDATPMATPGGAGATIETLLDTTIDELPTGHAVVAVDRWTLTSGSAAMTVAPHEGAVIITVESGEIIATAAETEHQLAAGDTFAPANQEVSLRASGAEDVTAFIVYLVSGFMDTELGHSDPVAHAVDYLISTSADALPGGSARVVLERLSLPRGSALPPQEASPLVWTEIGEGAVGLTLEGEQLPFRWKSGAERTFRGGQYLPVVQPGTRMTLRNAEDRPLVLYRLTITPSGTEGLAAATPGP
jgi:hypothetical protein